MATELVAIELQLKGAEGVYQDLQKLDNMLQGFTGAKGKKEIELDLGKSKQRLLELRGEINLTKEELERLGRAAADAKNRLRNSGLDKESEGYRKLRAEADKAQAAYDKEYAHLKKVQNEYRDVTMRVNEYTHALKNAQTTWMQLFSKTSTGLKHIGQNMQTLGNTLTRLGSPFNRVITGALFGAGYKGLNLITEGLGNAFTRYDTMRKYEQIMASYEKANYSAAKSKEELDTAVQGLPTSLDEIMSVAQRFTATSGNIEKGTQLAIAANNAFLASMSTDTQRYQGMMQLQDVIGGKKMNAKEWQALANSMMPAIRKIGEALGYEGEALNDYVASVQQGKVANKDFLDGLIKAGYGTDSVLGQIAEVSKQTWAALESNTKIAFARMGEAVLTALDDVAKGYNGKTLIQNLLEEKGVIDQWKDSIVGWIHSHPEEIVSFFQSLRKIDFASLGRGMLDGLKTLVEAVKWATDAFGDNGGMRKIGWFLTVAGPLGRVITTFGGALKGLSHPLALIFATVAKGVIMTKGEIGKGGGLLGMLGRILSGGGTAAEVAETAQTAEKAAEAAGKVAPKVGKFSAGLSNFFKGWAEVATMVGGTAFVAWGSMKLFKDAFKEFGEMVEIIKDIDWDTGAEAILGLGGFLTAVGGLSALAGGNLAAGLKVLKGELIVGAITSLALAFADLDMYLLKDSFKSFSDAVGYLKTGIDSLNSIGIIGDISKTRVRVSQAINTFNDIIDLFQNEGNGSKADDAQGKMGGKKLKTLNKGVVDTVKNLSSVLESMKGSIDAINEISHMKVNIGGVTSIMPKISTALIAIGQALTDIPINLTTEENAEEFANMSTALNNLKTAFSSLVGEDGVLAMIPKIVSSVMKMRHSDKLSSLVAEMDAFGAALKDMMNALNFSGFDTSALTTDVSNILKAVGDIQTMIGELKKIGNQKVDTKGTGNIQKVIENIKAAFDNAHASELSGQILVFVTAVKAALQTLKDLNEDIEIDITVKLSQGFYSSAKAVTKKITSTKDDIKKLAKQGVTATIPVRVHFSLYMNAGGVIESILDARRRIESAAKSAATPKGYGGNTRASYDSRFSATGGLIYRAKGGDIGFPGRPIGTDKIPAWLTEGEYVHRKQAVDFFGVDFMRAVNNMDVRGAMQSLLTRAGNSTNIGRQSIVNNTINNNQRVTQNISTNNPNFTRVQMGRFAGAL